MRIEIKYSEDFDGTVIDAIKRARELDDEYQPAYGTEITGLASHFEVGNLLEEYGLVVEIDQDDNELSYVLRDDQVIARIVGDDEAKIVVGDAEGNYANRSN